MLHFSFRLLYVIVILPVALRYCRPCCIIQGYIHDGKMKCNLNQALKRMFPLIPLSQSSFDGQSSSIFSWFDLSAITFLATTVYSTKI